MRKHHLRLGLGLLVTLCILPARAAAKPEAARQNTAARSAREKASERIDASTSAREQSKERGAPRAKTRAKKRELPPCFAKPVEFARDLGGEIETRSLSLTYCDGKPNPGALDALSVLARSRRVERPDASALNAYQRLPLDKGARDRRRDSAYVTRDIMRLHEGLIERLQRVAERFPGRALEIVSGHRPEARYTSRHHHGRALDFRVRGVSREQLRDFLRGFEATGVGYYPNSTFVHMDVRDDKGYWVDRSGPGEAPDYGVWPPPRRATENAEQAILRGALADLAGLGAPIEAGGQARPSRGVAVRNAAPPAPPSRSLQSANRFLSAAIGASRPRSAEEQAIAVEARGSAHDQNDEDSGPRSVEERAAISQSRPRSAEERLRREDPEPGDQLSASEIARIRRDALKALAQLR